MKTGTMHSIPAISKSNHLDLLALDGNTSKHLSKTPDLQAVLLREYGTCIHLYTFLNTMINEHQK
jgi:hypothetical protein